MARPSPTRLAPRARSSPARSRCALQSLNGLLSNLYQDLSSAQTGLSTLQSGVTSVEQILDQKFNVLVDETIIYPTGFTGWAGTALTNITAFFNYLGAALTNVQLVGPVLSPIFLDAAPGSQPAPATPPTPITSTDPRLATMLAAAEQEWAPAVGGRLPVDITLAVGPLAVGVLAESEVTGWNAQGQPTAGLIILSPDAAGRGWFIAPPDGTSGAFTQTLSTTAFAAQPGSAAYGEYDLFTALEHEIGHLLAFDPASASYEAHLQTIGGSQYFVGSGFSAQVTSGAELNPDVYPDDVMAGNLAPGIRKLPAALELDVVSTLWGTKLVTLVGPAASTAPTTTAVDHAIATLGSTPTVAEPAHKHARATKKAKNSKKAAHHSGHAVTIRVKHPEIKPTKSGAKPRVVAKPAEASAKKTPHTPNSDIAMQLSQRGKIEVHRPSIPKFPSVVEKHHKPAH